MEVNYFKILVMLGVVIQPALSGCRYGDMCYHCSKKNFTKIPTDVPVNVTFINLSWNFIQVVNTWAFKTLWKCDSINLMHNFIREIEDSAFQGLPARMHELYLSYNKLRMLRAAMWRGLKYIAVLSIRYNELRLLSFDSFGPEIDIFSLDFTSNKIVQIAPDTFSFMGQLSDLRLRENALQWVPCFSEHMNKTGNDIHSSVDVGLLYNPLKCQPKSCWYESWHETWPWLKGTKPKDCSTLKDADCTHPFQSLKNPWKIGKCCRYIEAKLDANCLKKVKGTEETSTMSDYNSKTPELIPGKCTLEIKVKPTVKTTLKPTAKPTLKPTITPTWYYHDEDMNVNAGNPLCKDIINIPRTTSKPGPENTREKHTSGVRFVGTKPKNIRKKQRGGTIKLVKKLRTKMPTRNGIKTKHTSTGVLHTVITTKRKSMARQNSGEKHRKLKRIEKKTREKSKYQLIKRKRKKQLQNHMVQRQMFCIKTMMLMKLIMFSLTELF